MTKEEQARWQAAERVRDIEWTKRTLAINLAYYLDDKTPNDCTERVFSREWYRQQILIWTTYLQQREREHREANGP